MLEITIINDLLNQKIYYCPYGSIWLNQFRFKGSSKGHSDFSVSQSVYERWSPRWSSWSRWLCHNFDFNHFFGWRRIRWQPEDPLEDPDGVTILKSQQLTIYDEKSRQFCSVIILILVPLCGAWTNLLKNRRKKKIVWKLLVIWRRIRRSVGSRSSCRFPTSFGRCG